MTWNLQEAARRIKYTFLAQVVRTAGRFRTKKAKASSVLSHRFERNKAKVFAWRIPLCLSSSGF
jgi:hypothetical protein